jgi:hypothetical protein
VTKPKRKHTDESKPGPSMATSNEIAQYVESMHETLSRLYPTVAPEAIAMEISAAAWRLTGGAK